MKNLLMILVLVATVAMAEDKTIKGKDLTAWKLARHAVEMSKYAAVYSVEDCEPTPESMTKTKTGDYKFTFTAKGKPNCGRPDGWELCTRVFTVKVEDIGDELKTAGIEAGPVIAPKDHKNYNILIR